jgi:hypothetical protein
LFAVKSLPKLAINGIAGIKKLPQKPVVIRCEWKFDFLTSQARAGSFRILESLFKGGYLYGAFPLISYPGFSVLHFRHHRFLGHRQDIGFSSVFRLSSLFTA